MTGRGKGGKVKPKRGHKSRVVHRTRKVKVRTVQTSGMVQAPQLKVHDVSIKSLSDDSRKRQKRMLDAGGAATDGNQKRYSKRIRLQHTPDNSLIGITSTETVKETRKLKTMVLRRERTYTTNTSAAAKRKILTRSQGQVHPSSLSIRKTPGKTSVALTKIPRMKKKSFTVMEKSKPNKTKSVQQKMKNAPVHKSKSKENHSDFADGNNNVVTVANQDKSDEIVADKKIKPKREKKPTKARNRLDPKTFVTEYLQDPTFYSREHIPHISTFANSRLLIRAVLLNDNDLLQELIIDKSSFCSLKMNRSLNEPRDAFNYAIERVNTDAMYLLIESENGKDLAPFPSIILKEETTGHNSTYMFGHAVRAVTVGRGGREGNNALLKDKDGYSTYGGNSTQRTGITNDDFHQVIRNGASMATLEKIYTELTLGTWENLKEDLCSSITEAAIRSGCNQVAGELVKFALEKGGFGFNKLHEEVLLNTTEPLTPFKSVSVIKKATGNSRITPLHCVCINPNPDYLTELLQSNPAYDVSDYEKWLPIHYAAVCTGKGPLAVLLSREIPICQYNKLGESPLHLAALLGRVENVELLLEHELKTIKPEVASQSLLERKTKEGYTPLHIAVRAGHLEVVKALIRGGANPSKYTPAQVGKLSPLMLSAQKGHLDILKFLIESGVKIDAVNNRRQSALTHAVIDGQAHIVSFLLRLGANHKIVDTSLNTLVHYAAAYGWYFNLKLLLEAGCPLNEENAWKMTPLVIAFSKGHMGIVEFILGKCDVNINSIINEKNGMTLLLQTCEGSPLVDYFSKIKFLVEEQNADVSITDFDKNTPLHHVIMNDGRQMNANKIKHSCTPLQETIFEVVKLLIDRGCDPFAKNSANKSPIFLSLTQGCFRMFCKFLEWGFPLPDEKDDQGNTILHIIVNHRDSDEAMQLLNKCSSDPALLKNIKDMANVSNNSGFPPLLHLLRFLRHVSDSEQRSRVVKYLRFLIETLDADVEAVVSDEKSKSSIFHILTDVCDEIVEEALKIVLPLYFNLEVEDAERLTPLAVAVSKDRKEVAAAFINAGANVNIKVADGTSLLLKLGQSSEQSLFLLKLVLEKGGNIFEAHQTTGNTLLHYLVRNPNTPNITEVVEQLIEAGVDVNAKNSDGRTAMHLIVDKRGGETDSAYEIENLLIKAGANLALRDKRGRLPLHMAFVKIGKHEDRSFIDPIDLVALLIGAMKNSVGSYAAEIKKGDEFGATPLHYAAFRGASISCSYIMMLMNGDVNILDKSGNSPFGLAVLNGHEGCSLQFKQLGADFSVMLNPSKQTKIEPPPEKCWEWKYLTSKKEEVYKNKVIPTHPIVEEVINKNWQGILYLILESLNTSGVGCSIAIASAIRTGKLKLADKLVDRAVASELVTKDGNTLLHTLANGHMYENVLVEKIIKTLIKKGVSLFVLDADGCTPLTLAAVRRNAQICQILVQMTPKEKQGLFNTGDKYGRNPPTAMLWSLETQTVITKELKIWSKNLLDCGLTMNTLCAFPIRIQSYPSVRYLRCESMLKLKSVEFNYTPLIFAVIIGNHDVVKWLLTMKIPIRIDINGKDHKGRTALMHACRLNDIKMVKILLNPDSYDPEGDVNPWPQHDLEKTLPDEMEISNSDLSFSIKDKQGWTAADYLVAPSASFYYEKAAMILAILGKRLQLLLKSGDGISPLERAINMRRWKTVQVIEELLGIDVGKITKTDSHEELYQPKYSGSDVGENFITDCQEMTKIMIAEEKANSTDGKEASPDPVLEQSDPSKKYTVVIDDKDNTPYNCSLIHVDLSYGTYGLYNFYKMQVVEQERGTIKLILLYTRWGRVGDTGQYQKTPFPTVEEAIKEFKKVFRSKTGNSWENLSTFTPMDKKFRLVNEESETAMNQPSAVQIDFALLDDSAAQIPRDPTVPNDVYQLIHSLFLAHSHVSYNSRIPRGSLTFDSYKRGEEILQNIALLIKPADTSDAAAANATDNENKIKAIEMLSEEFYALIPDDAFTRNRITSITSESVIRQKREIINKLTHLNLASQIILAAQYNLSSNLVNPFDYIYRTLNVHMQVLHPKNEEAQMILEYIHNSHDCDITNIYSLERFGELERFRNLGNSYFLWHGTGNVNLLSILKSGLQIAPLGTRLNGDLFGKGIYFSDTFKKSARYCGGGVQRYVFLCEVSLGNIYPVNFSYNEGLEKKNSPPDGFHSLKTNNTRFEPNPSSTVIWKERTIPLGQPIERITKPNTYYGLENNEYIVFDEGQVILRYLIEFI